MVAKATQVGYVNLQKYFQAITKFAKNTKNPIFSKVGMAS